LRLKGTRTNADTNTGMNVRYAKNDKQANGMTRFMGGPHSAIQKPN